MKDGNKFSIIHPLMPLSPHCIAFSDVMLLCISSASVRFPFVSFDSSLRFVGIVKPPYFLLYYLISSFFPFSLFPCLLLVFFPPPASFVRLLLRISQYSQGVTEASEAFIFIINSVPHSAPVTCVCERNILLYFKYAPAASH